MRVTTLRADSRLPFNFFHVSLLQLTIDCVTLPSYWLTRNEMRICEDCTIYWFPVAWCTFLLLIWWSCHTRPITNIPPPNVWQNETWRTSRRQPRIKINCSRALFMHYNEVDEKIFTNRQRRSKTSHALIHQNIFQFRYHFKGTKNTYTPSGFIFWTFRSAIALYCLHWQLMNLERLSF